MRDIATTWAASAGLGGIALSVLLFVFRDVIRKNIFPELNQAQAYRIIRLVIVCTFLIALVGLIIWFLRERQTIQAQHEESLLKVKFSLGLGEASAALLNDGAPRDEVARALRLARLTYMEQMRADPKAYQLFVNSTRQAKQLLKAQAPAIPEEDVARAEAALNRGEVTPAINALRLLGERRTADVAEVKFITGQLLISTAEFDEALHDLIAASQAMPANREYFNDAVELALNVGKPDVAEKLIQSRLSLIDAGVVTDSGDRPFYLGLSGLASWYKGDLDEAERKFEEAIKDTGGQPSLVLASLLNDSSPIYKSRGQWDKSEARLTRAARIYGCLLPPDDPRHVNVLANLAAVYVLEGHFLKANALLERAKRGVDSSGLMQPSDRYLAAHVNVVRGNLLRSQDKLEEAQAALLEALSLLKGLHAAQTFAYARATTYLGSLHIQKNDLDVAKKYLQEALSLDIKLFGDRHLETANAYALLAVISIAKNDAAEASYFLTNAKHATEGQPASSSLNARMLEAEAEIDLLNRRPEALKTLETACVAFARIPNMDPQQVARCDEKLRTKLRDAGIDRNPGRISPALVQRVSTSNDTAALDDVTSCPAA